MMNEREVSGKIISTDDACNWNLTVGGLKDYDHVYVNGVRYVEFQPEQRLTDEQLLEYRNTQVAGLREENSKLREDLRVGISLRDHFAGLAMQGFLAADYNDWDYEKFALTSYEQADAMLKEREKQ
jgi:hypothetical protein